MKPDHRARRLLALAAIVAAIVIAVPRFLTHAPYARLGVKLDWSTDSGLARVSDVVGPPASGVLQKGDVLLHVAGVPATSDELGKISRNGGLPRGPIELVFERNGHARVITLPPVQLGAWQRVRLFTFPLAAVIAAPIVAFLLVWRRPDLGAAWVFLWFAALQALGTVWGLFQFPQQAPSGAFKAYLDFYDGLTFWFPAAFLHFMTVVPRPRWKHPGPWRSVWFWLVALAYATPPVLWLVSRTTGQSAEHLYVIFQGIVLPLGVLSLVNRYAWPGRGERRPQMSERVPALIVAVTLLLATVLRIVSDDPRVLPYFSMPLVRVFYTTVSVAWLTSPLLIAFLIANDPVFDPRRLLVQSLPYALLSGVLAALYLGIVVGAQRLFAETTGEEAVVFNVVAALIVAFAFAPLRDRVQHTLDRIYGRDPRALRAALDQAGHELLGALDRDDLRASVEAGLARGLKRRLALEWPDSGAPRLADGESLPEDARAAVENLLLQAGIRLENLALQEQRAAAERQSVELREAATRAELRALLAQVQPHFLFNALNALSYLTETDPPAAQRFTERLADMLRYTVEAGERPAALLSEELGFVEAYLGVARERYENPLDFNYRGAPELLSLAVPPLLLQPLVENSLKHGCPPGTDALHLELEAERRDGWLELTFSDNGVATGDKGPGLGVGLQNLEQRVRRFAGAGASMVAGPVEGGGYAVTLRWPAPPDQGANGITPSGSNGAHR
jgi:signal transduction histidine kinase